MGAPKPIENEKPKNSDADTVNSPDAFNADIILPHLGRFGKFQAKFLFCIGYGLLFPTAAVLIYTFVGATPAYR